MSAVAKIDDARPKREIIEVVDPIPVLDTSRFEHMQRIANVMAQSTLIPESLYKEKDKELPLSQIVSNCFLVVNQAVRWGLDPFAVAQSVAVVRGKLCYEGKLVSAVLDAKLGVRLHHHFIGDPTKPDLRIYTADLPFDDEMVAALKPGVSLPGVRITDGSVADFSTGDKGAWGSVKNYRRMCIYRNSRDWARFFEPAVLLGVYTPDEMMDLAESAKANRAREINERPSLMQRLQSAPAAVTDQREEGFDADFINRETSPSTETEQSEIDEPSDAFPSVGAESGAVANPETPGPALDQSEDELPMDALPAQLKAELTDDDYGWLMDTAKVLWAATEAGKGEVLERTFAGVKKTIPAFVSDAAMGLGTQILETCRKVCRGDMERAIALKIVANAAGCSEREVTA